MVTRPAQNDETQQWIFAPVGTICTIRKLSSGRFLDAYKATGSDFGVVTRGRQNDDQRWWVERI